MCSVWFEGQLICHEIPKASRNNNRHNCHSAKQKKCTANWHSGEAFGIIACDRPPSTKSPHSVTQRLNARTQLDAHVDSPTSQKNPQHFSLGRPGQLHKPQLSPVVILQNKSTCMYIYTLSILAFQTAAPRLLKTWLIIP